MVYETDGAFDFWRRYCEWRWPEAVYAGFTYTVVAGVTNVDLFTELCGVTFHSQLPMAEALDDWLVNHR